MYVTEAMIQSRGDDEYIIKINKNDVNQNRSIELIDIPQYPDIELVMDIGINNRTNDEGG